MFIRCRMQGRASSIVLLPIYGTSCLHPVPLSRDSAPPVEVCPLARGVMLSIDATPICPITEQLSLSPRSLTRSPFGLPHGSLSLQGHCRGRENYGLTTFRVRTCVGWVSPLRRWRTICVR